MAFCGSSGLKCCLNYEWETCTCWYLTATSRFTLLFLSMSAQANTRCARHHWVSESSDCSIELDVLDAWFVFNMFFPVSNRLYSGLSMSLLLFERWGLFYKSFITNAEILCGRSTWWCSKIWSSAQDYVVLVLILNVVESFVFAWLTWAGGNDWYQLSTSSQLANMWGWPWTI